MAYISTPLNPVLFPHELALLTIERDDTAEQYFRIAADLDGTRLLDWQLSFTTNTFTLQGLDELIRSHLGDQSGVHTLHLWTAEAGSWESTAYTLIPCRHLTDQDAATFTTTRFLTAAAGSKPTHPQATEYLTAYDPEASGLGLTFTLTADAIATDGTHTIKTTTQLVSHINGRGSVNVSPAAIAATLGINIDTLAAYTIQCGNRTMNYHLIRPTTAPISVHFIGAFGQPDTFHFFGFAQTETKVERSTNIIGGQLRAHDIRTNPETKAHTGAMPQSILPLFADLCTATTATHDSHAITITDQENKTTSSPYALQEGTLTWRESAQGLRIPPIGNEAQTTTTGIFDDTFDETFN